MAQSTLSDYKNNLFSNHFLEERIQDRGEWQELNFEEKFDELREFYQEKEGILSENLNEDQTQDNFIDPVLRKLGHDWVTEASKKVGSRTDGKTLNPDYAFMNSSEKLKVHQDNEDPLELDYAVGDAKAWNRTLDKSSQDHTNPAFQIYNYVDRLRADWGLLTNGKKWRLYSYEDCAADIYFEVDLENLLAGEKTEEKLESFKYFYLLFRAESFENGFLEEIYQESVNFAEGLEDDLEDKVYNALEVAVEGFFETNDIEKTPENIDLVHHASLIFLYRILFILNAESRDLLPTEYEAYKQAFGLTQLKRMIIEEDVDDPLFQETTVAWDNRISRLFEGIDDGYDLNETEIPAYNGGLFDEENGPENEFLAENKLYGTYLKEILELLATSYDEEKEKRIILDYKDLNIRHLGSVYEGLLEHKFKAADERKVLKNEEWQDFSESKKNWEDFDEEKRVEENELYLTNESGERKATGSYYTPEYIVEYIVENTVGPKVEEKISEAEENNENILPKVLDLNVCDPAMGSGHFLTEATEFIAENIVEHADLEKQEIEENEDELNWAKRQVVQNCIYGVDINPLAVELGKLSLWIETMAEGKPLNFLDHHLKHGNSLIGSDFDEIFSHPTEDQKRLDSERYKFGNPQEIKENFQEQYLEIEQMPENTVEQIHEKEQAYKQFISNNTLYQQFQQLANIHTRQFFQSEANSSDYESFLINIGNPSNPFQDNEWYQDAQEDAENRNYFHWQLEFPKVFFGEQNGFDAVVGNPPYARIQSLKENFPEAAKYYEKRYDSSTQNFDIYANFTEKGWNTLDENGLLGYIEPHKFFQARMGEGLRDLISENKALHQVTHFGEHQVFPEASVYTCLLFLSRTPQEKFNYAEVKPEQLEEGQNIEHFKISADYSSDSWSFNNPKEEEILDKIEQAGKTLGDRTHKIFQGLVTSADDIFLVRLREENEETAIVESDSEGEFEIEKDLLEPFLKGGEIHRYDPLEPKLHLIFPYERIEGEAKFIDEEKLESNYPKCHKYFKKHEEELRKRDGGNMDTDRWFDLTRPQNLMEYTKDYIVTPRMGNNPEFTCKTSNIHHNSEVEGVVFKESESLQEMEALSVLNSKIFWFFLTRTGTQFRGGFYNFRTDYIAPFSLPSYEKFKGRDLGSYSKKIIERKKSLDSINLNIRDYLGNYSDGKTLGDLYSPVEGLSDKVVSDTSADRDSLRIGNIGFEESGDDLVLRVSARYKPEESEGIDESELDQWGYYETGKVPAMKFTGLSKEMKSLVEEFTNLAVDEAGGFADFRESATKTNSIIDRLEKLTLPKLEDVEQGLEKFVENREEAEKLEDEIQETDELIDAIVFNLYDLTEEEVETVLDSLDTSEDEKASILENFGEVQP